MKPGKRCPYEGGICQTGCWLWSMEGAPGKCSAPIVFPESESNPREFYTASLVSLGEVD